MPVVRNPSKPRFTCPAKVKITFFLIQITKKSIHFSKSEHNLA